MRRIRPRRKGQLIKKDLTNKNKRFILIYVNTKTQKTQTIDIYESLEEARQELDKKLNTFEKDSKGIFHIISEDNRVLYSEKEEE